MATSSMTLIQTQTVGAGGASSIDFTNVPQTFTDIVILLSARGTGNSVARIAFNGTGTTYSERVLQGDGGVASSFTETNFAGHIVPSTHTANTFANAQIYIPNYTSATTKSFSIESATENNAASAYTNVIAGNWNGTGAITSISLTSSNFAQYSSASLYGISNATTNGTPKATGGTISYGIGGVVYHTFTASGTFTPTTTLTADYLIVGGGGGGGAMDGSRNSGGGGAGGYRAFTGATFTPGSYPVVIGAGGVGGAKTTIKQTSGSASTFNALSAAGGGYGGGTAVPSNLAGASGGSGGGAWQTTNYGLGNTPATTPSQGNAGGIDNYTNGGGGGGASAAGGNGPGGNGSTWLDGKTYAGGGGGGRRGGTDTWEGGTGGGGRGGNNGSWYIAGIAGTANTGGGGGAGSDNLSYPAGAGGSGVVVVRYQG